MKLKHTLLIACLGTVPLHAQQAVEKAEVKKAEKADSTSGEASASASATAISNGDVKIEIHASDAQSNKPQNSRNPGQPTPQQDQKPVAYIGVLTREVSSELRAQFSLPEGFGLVVGEVMPDSPAKAACLKEHDILVKFEDQQLVNMEQFMSLVRAKKKGDVVKLVVITGGKEATVPVTLGERMAAANENRPRYEFNNWPQMGMPFSGRLDNLSGDYRVQTERFQKEMREYQERIQDWAKNGRNGPMPQPPVFQPHGGSPQQGGQGGGGRIPQPGNSTPGGKTNHTQNFSVAHAAVNITRRDEAGEYSIKREDGKAIFTVRPNNGKEQSWPINNEAERNAVPAEYRDKLRMMDGVGSGIRIEVNPGNGGTFSHPPSQQHQGTRPASPSPLILAFR